MNRRIKIRVLTTVCWVMGASIFAQPILTGQPLSVTNLAGTTATFSVGAEGTPPLAFQWLYGVNGFTYPLAGDTNASLTLSNVQSFNAAGSYWVVVSNSEGSVTSSIVTLTILTPPKIIRQPTDQTASLFADASFLGLANGDAPLSYQWWFNGGPLLGMTNTILDVTNIQRANAGNFTLVVTNSVGSITSQVATLTIVPFNSLYCFGQSWTDTHNAVWTSPQYYNLRGCNGPMWPEFLSTNLELRYVQANNYAVVGATSSDELTQATSFTVPPKPQLSVYFLWSGGSELLKGVPNYDLGYGFLDVTNEPAWNQFIETVLLNNSNVVNRLYTKGARSIVIQRHFDLSKTPFALVQFGADSVRLSRYSNYIWSLNAALVAAMDAYSHTHPDLRLMSVDVFSKLNEVLENPSLYGFTKTTMDALDDPLLSDKSFTGPGAQYVFWDHLHATSKLHDLMAGWYLEALTNSVLESLNVAMAGSSPRVEMDHLLIGRDYTLQRSSDLAQWNDVQTFTAAAGTNQWAGGSSGATAGFYRLIWQP